MMLMEMIGKHDVGTLSHSKRSRHSIRLPTLTLTPILTTTATRPPRHHCQQYDHGHKVTTDLLFTHAALFALHF